MENTPKSLRLQIALVGRTNVGKSSFLNMICKQDISVTSPMPGTTTDIVEKSIELLPIGPVTFLDTGGIDDESILSEKRIERTMKTFNRADVVVLVVDPNIWSDYENDIVKITKEKNIPLIIVINKFDLVKPSNVFINEIKEKTNFWFIASSRDESNSDKYIYEFKKAIQNAFPKEFIQQPPLLNDLISPGGIIVFIIPIDLQAPKGRLILPQVQSLRDTLDSDAIGIVVKEKEYPYLLTQLVKKPDLVICDSQVVMKMVADTPPDIKCTTFSILFSRYKGDLVEEVRGVTAIDKIKPGDKILIAEACSHHPLEDDIGRVKIPRWLRQYLGMDTIIDFANGRDYPSNLSDYKLIIHCGSCMLTRNEKLVRIQLAKDAGVPITNYGLTISHIQGVLKRALSPFPAALEVYSS